VTADLRSSLKARGSSLLVLRGNPQEVLPKVWKDWQITRLCFELDTEEYAKERDSKITAAAKAAGVHFFDLANRMRCRTSVIKAVSW
jgi:cryptochrome